MLFARLAAKFVRACRSIPVGRNDLASGAFTMRRVTRLALIAIFLSAAATTVRTEPAARSVAVAPQYDSTHVYVAPADFNKFVTSFLATFGGTASKQGLSKITPTPSLTIWQFVQTPVGALSVLGFKTPIPYPFGTERTGYLVTDMDIAIRAARANGADVIVEPFADGVGRDAVIQWPGGVNMQLYWHVTATNYPKLQTIPENRVYVSSDRAKAFVYDFLAFAHGTVVSDDAKASGVEIGRPRETYRRVLIESAFGKMLVLVTDGHLPYPYGREMTGYEVADLDATLAKAKSVGATILVEPYAAAARRAAIVEFPGGYVAEIHAAAHQ
jgi:predicted enzyme related to lactoylglutathione lyase